MWRLAPLGAKGGLSALAAFIIALQVAC